MKLQKILFFASAVIFIASVAFTAGFSLPLSAGLGLLFTLIGSKLPTPKHTTGVVGMNMVRPMPGASTTFEKTGVAKDAMTGVEKPTFNTFNNFQGNAEIQLTFDNTGESNAARTDLSIFPKITNTSPSTLPTGLTVSGTFTWAQWLQLIQREDFFIKSMRIQTSNTSNFTYTLNMGVTRFDNVDVPEKVNLTKYRKPTGNGYSDVVDILDKPFTNKARFFMLLSNIAAGTTVTFYFTVAAEGNPTLVQTS